MSDLEREAVMAALPDRMACAGLAVPAEVK
jgi:hypothetical protein